MYVSFSSCSSFEVVVCDRCLLAMVFPVSVASCGVPLSFFGVFFILYISRIVFRSSFCGFRSTSLWLTSEVKDEKTTKAHINTRTERSSVAPWGFLILLHLLLRHLTLHRVTLFLVPLFLFLRLRLSLFSIPMDSSWVVFVLINYIWLDSCDTLDFFK